ncbi:ABC transporter ATP-binding protein [Haladaptatus sp. W1]|uniref:energy-coupling factor ABC transporter ATP-binding protein n=1 Tax=Haladaptatus sp. W1 TaxID=1897478 RepID=UPI000849DB3C|nr:ABC transporter ATP-binding protein [Haladaptatus sp. W1]ODR82646.1 ABC transporter ATP-binding protein [Haladaptatus sp. W1]
MITTHNLVHRFGDAVALSGVSLTIPDGEFVVISGPNGSGKTTFVRHFNGLLSADEGTVLVDETPVEDDLVAARTRVGMVFQHPRDTFVSATVGADVAFGPENLGLPREEIDRRVETSLSAVGMADRRDARIDTLSGGECQRVAIAGALAMEPAHLVLDEPFTGLDGPARKSVVSHLETLSASGTGIIVVTHDLRDIWSLADRAVALRDGKIAVDGSPEETASELARIGIRTP